VPDVTAIDAFFVRKRAFRGAGVHLFAGNGRGCESPDYPFEHPPQTITNFPFRMRVGGALERGNLCTECSRAMLEISTSPRMLFGPHYGRPLPKTVRTMMDVEWR
jgi:hypothetical protein